MINTQSASFLSSIKPSDTWGFANLTQKNTRYITHGYHRYPAKYIPQIAQQLIKDYSKPRDLVVDPFGGCGTTVVEAKISNRQALAIDINPVAVMISRAKINAIKPANLQSALERFQQRYNGIIANKQNTVPCPDNDRIDYWFRPAEKSALAQILSAIRGEKTKKYELFLLCAFSNILKNCSMWHMKSNKPLFKADKIPSDPITQFQRQIKSMTKMNAEYYDLLESTKNKSKCRAKKGSAENIPVGDGEAHLVVTSPPYVTSYEYADLHQLTALWMEWMNNLSDFRKNFIGSSYAKRSKNSEINSSIATAIIEQLRAQNSSISAKTEIYYADMNKVFSDIHRILRPKGRACIVIGDTELRGVKIENTRVFIEQMQNLGFKIADVFCREIISKCIPSTRNAKTGKFTSVKNSDKFAYPIEYIIIGQKQ